MLTLFALDVWLLQENYEISSLRMFTLFALDVWLLQENYEISSLRMFTLFALDVWLLQENYEISSQRKRLSNTSLYTIQSIRLESSQNQCYNCICIFLIFLLCFKRFETLKRIRDNSHNATTFYILPQTTINYWMVFRSLCCQML